MICPHKKELFFNNKYGIKLYSHKDDNTPCNYLNSLLVKLDDVLFEYSKQLDEDIIFTSCLKLRKQKYYEFSKCKNEKEAIKILKFFAEQYKRFPINEELNYVFGKEKILNIFVDYDLEVTTNGLGSLPYLPTYLNKLQIPDCINKKLKNIGKTIDALKQKVNKINNNKKNMRKYYNF